MILVDKFEDVSHTYKTSQDYIYMIPEVLPIANPSSVKAEPLAFLRLILSLALMIYST